MSWPQVETAATLAALGLPAWRYLTTGSNHERVLLAAVAQKALDVRDRMDKRLAIEISNAKARSQKRG